MKKANLTIVLLTVLFLASTAAAVVFYMGKNTEQSRRIYLEDQMRRITQAKAALQKEKDEILKEKELLEGKVGDLTSQAQELSDQIAAEKRAREALTTEVAQSRKEVGSVQERLKTEQDEKRTLTSELSKAKQSYQALSNELTTLRQAKEALERRVKEMLAARAKQAEQIVVKPAPTQPAPSRFSSARSTPARTTPARPAPVVRQPAPTRTAPARQIQTDGKVLVLNKEFDFVVVNLGSADGLRSGSELEVIRNNRPVATLQVEKLYENMAAATVMEEAMKDEIQVDDLIRVR